MGFLIDYIKDGLLTNSASEQPKKKMPQYSVIKDLLRQPDKFMLEGWVEDGEIRITVRRNEKSTPLSEG